MLTGDQYIAVVAHRLQRVRAQLYQAQIGPVMAMIGNTYDGIGPISQMHFCIVAASLSEVNGFMVGDFTQRAAQHANQATNGIRGFGTAVITFAGLISPRVHPDAVAAATAKPGTSFGGDTRPVVVDLSTGQVHMYTGTKFYGFALQGAIKAKAQASFPPPAVAAMELAQIPPPPPGPPAGQFPPPGPQQPPAAGPYPQPGPYQQPPAPYPSSGPGAPPAGPYRSQYPQN